MVESITDSKTTVGYLAYKTKRKELLLTESEKKRNRTNLGKYQEFDFGYLY